MIILSTLEYQAMLEGAYLEGKNSPKTTIASEVHLNNFMTFTKEQAMKLEKISRQKAGEKITQILDLKFNNV